MLGVTFGIGVGMFLFHPQSVPAQNLKAVSDATYLIATTSTPEVSTDAFLVFDIESGETLLSHNEQKVFPIASVTKLLSATAFYMHTDLAATTSLTVSDIATTGKAGRFAIGDTPTHHELIFAALLESSNDAAAAMERVEPELITYMQDIIDEKLASETFVVADASGLSTRNAASVEDLAHLYTYVYREYPHILDITKLGAYYTQDGGWLNNNPFIDEAGYQGGKHGYLPESGRTVVSVFAEELASGGRRNLGYVLLGSENLVRDMALLRDFTKEHVSYQ